VKCSAAPPAYSAARSFGYYRGELAAVLRNLKFGGRRNLAALLAAMMAHTFSATWERSEFDFVVAVPLHPEGFANVDSTSRSCWLPS